MNYYSGVRMDDEGDSHATEDFEGFSIRFLKIGYSCWKVLNILEVKNNRGIKFSSFKNTRKISELRVEVKKFIHGYINKKNQPWTSDDFKKKFKVGDCITGVSDGIAPHQPIIITAIGEDDFKFKTLVLSKRYPTVDRERSWPMVEGLKCNFRMWAPARYRCDKEYLESIQKHDYKHIRTNLGERKWPTDNPQKRLPL